VDLVPLDLSDESTAGDVLRLQRDAYRVEAHLIGSDEIPPLRETLADLQSCGETFLGGRIDGTLVGAISWRVEDDTIDLHRLVVDPAHFRKGIATTLLRGALDANPFARRAIVQTGASNEPALSFYRREGFVQTDELEPAPGLRVARFTRLLDDR
jgi:ribosomal protein S18 acetylase RimI-like enzyme